MANNLNKRYYFQLTRESDLNNTPSYQDQSRCWCTFCFLLFLQEAKILQSNQATGQFSGISQETPKASVIRCYFFCPEKCVSSRGKKHRYLKGTFLCQSIFPAGRRNDLKQIWRAPGISAWFGSINSSPLWFPTSFPLTAEKSPESWSGSHLAGSFTPFYFYSSHYQLSLIFPPRYCMWQLTPPFIALPQAACGAVWPQRSLWYRTRKKMVHLFLPATLNDVAIAIGRGCLGKINVSLLFKPFVNCFPGCALLRMNETKTTIVLGDLWISCKSNEKNPVGFTGRKIHMAKADPTA